MIHYYPKYIKYKNKYKNLKKKQKEMIQIGGTMGGLIPDNLENLKKNEQFFLIQVNTMYLEPKKFH